MSCCLRPAALCPSAGLPEEMRKLLAVVAPWALHHASVPRHAVRPGRLLKPAAAELHKLSMEFLLVKHLVQPAVLKKNAAPALALRLRVSNQHAHLFHLF